MLTSRDIRREEFYANRRIKRHKFKESDPEAEYEALRLDKKYREEYMITPASERLMKAAIEYFLVQLRTRKIVPEYHRNNKEIRFFYHGYCQVKYCHSGYITIQPPDSGVERIQFIVKDGRDIIEKLIRYGVLKKEDFK
jgi:hypothetical protein